MFRLESKVDTAMLSELNRLQEKFNTMYSSYYHV